MGLCVMHELTQPRPTLDSTNYGSRQHFSHHAMEYGVTAGRPYSPYILRTFDTLE